MKPPVLNFAIPQRKEDSLCYAYDSDINMNVINTEKGKMKFIDVANGYLEFATKTDVVRERDDVGERLEFATKTEINRERDDDALEFMTKTATSREADDNRVYNMAEFTTKTSIQRESDDDRIAMAMLEFVTKTKVERESDDI